MKAKEVKAKGRAVEGESHKLSQTEIGCAQIVTTYSLLATTRVDCVPAQKNGWGEDGGWGQGKGKGDWGPYGKGKGGIVGKGKFGPATAKGIKGVIDQLIVEGLPGGRFDHNANSLYLTNLPPDTTNIDLYTIFSCFGAIPPRGVRVMPGIPGQRGYGFVNYIDHMAAEF